HTALGELLVDGGQGEEGRSELEQALKLKPGDSQAALLLAAYYLHASTDPNALQRAGLLLTAAAQGKTYPAGRVYLLTGELNNRLGKPRDAVQALLTAKRAGLDDERVEFALTQAYSSLHDSRLAGAESRLAQLRKLMAEMLDLQNRLRGNPGNLAVRLHLGLAYLALNMPQLAIGQLGAYLSQRPSDAAAGTAYNKAIALLKAQPPQQMPDTL
ncbi:MAG TPA: hypothetical protein VGS41_15635, partial [Chthonomonadales bacterium]|nr:hypothetical protein [Chthonomonadales bacterium]